MAMEPITLFSRIADPARVARRLRELAPAVEIGEARTSLAPLTPATVLELPPHPATAPTNAMSRTTTALRMLCDGIRRSWPPTVANG